MNEQNSSSSVDASMCEKEKNILKNILKILGKEFGFYKYDEETGNILIKDGKMYEYRGFSIWLKEVVESLFALFIILFTLIFISKNIYDFFSGNLIEIPKLISQILEYVGYFLVIDALFLIAVLISSPGIDETIDSVSVSLAAVLVLILGSLDFAKIKESPLLIISTVLPLSILIVFLVFAKHHIKEKANKKVN